MTDPAKIAALAVGLSAYERRAISGRIMHITNRDGLVSKGLIYQPWCPNWTPLGIAMQNYLEEQDDAK